MSIVDYIYRHAQTRPQHPAVVDGANSLNFAELREAGNHWAAALHTAGLQPGDRVGVCLRDNSDFLLALLGGLQAGLTVVPLDWRAPAAETEGAVAAFSLSAVVGLPGGKTLKSCKFIVVDASWQAAVKNSAPLQGLPDHGAPAFIKLSSGTTGTPKGAIVLHREFVARLERNLAAFGNLENHRYFSVLPLCFSGGVNYCMFHLMLGNTVILYPPLFSPTEYVTALRESQATFTFAVPAVLRWLLELPRTGQPLLPELKILLTGTAPLSGAEKRAVLTHVSPNLWECFSSSAAGQICILRPEDIPDHADSVGKANPRVTAEIVDENFEPLPAGQVGRLRCRAEGTCSRYWGETSGSEHISDGWCYTGDLAERDTAGYYYLRGRADHVIIRGGINIYPETVETALLAHPAVREAAVFGVDDPVLGQRVAAAVVCASAAKSNELLAWCRSRLAPHMQPEQIYIEVALPKTSAGKIRRREIHKALTHRLN